MTTNAERWAVAKFTRSTAINAQAAKIEAHRERCMTLIALTLEGDSNNVSV
jgi:hypothetical protein